MRECFDRLVWKKEKELGRGGFGIVSLVELDKDITNSYGVPPLMAVKSFEISQSRSLVAGEEFLRELGNCPNVVRCYGSSSTLEYGIGFNNLFLEFAPGDSLADRRKGLCQRGLLMHESEVKRHAKSILFGLTCIHSKGIVHCDIKPHNILLVADDHLMTVADFGLAKRVGEKDDQPQKIRGTPLYYASESANRKYDPPCDIWALRCTVLEIITGKPPWDYDKSTIVWNILVRIVCTNNIPEIPEWVSKDAKNSLGKCFVKDPKHRWTADMLLRHPFITLFSDGLKSK